MDCISLRTSPAALKVRIPGNPGEISRKPSFHHFKDYEVPDVAHIMAKVFNSVCLSFYPYQNRINLHGFPGNSARELATIIYLSISRPQE